MSDIEAFRNQANVSRETMERFRIYADLLVKWNKTINLVSRTTLDQLWTRHFLDSAAAYQIAEASPGRWVDLGSGAGFPGTVLAIIAKEKSPDTTVTCIETDIRKCEFLRTVARQTGVQVSVFSRRIEETPPQNANVLTARALTSLTSLLEYADRHLNKQGVAVFHKGKAWTAEVEDALNRWNFDYKAIPSVTDPEAVLLEIRQVTRV